VSTDLPYISVIVPMRNEAGHIDACIESILAQDYPLERRELIIVDGNSDDASPQILASYGTQLRLFQNPRRIVPTAMNIGIRAARGEIIARVDAHTQLATDYLSRGVEALRRTGADNVGGPMISVGGGLVGDAIAAAMASRFGIGAYFHFATEDREVDTVYMGMWRRSAFERIGLFDEELVRNQDDELNYRLRKAGGRVCLSMEMRSTYQNRQSLKTLAKQFFQYGIWKIRVLQKHPMQMSLRHFVPPALVAALLSLTLLALVVPRGIFLLGALILSYAAVLAVAGFQIGRQQGLAIVPVSIVAIATMHLCWGAGFMLGLLKFWPRWLSGEQPPPQLGRGECVPGEN
jgi:succinoglycan biosynthesis protein ExoA